jgi:hypothetical protein
MAALDVHHRIYTHAKASGGRFVDVARDAKHVLPQVALAELDDLMKKLAPAGSEPAWAVRCFAGEKDARFVCAVVAYGGIRDASGREGLLTHARVVRIDRHEARGEVCALIDAASAVPIEDVRAASDPVRAYAARAVGNTIDVRELADDSEDGDAIREVASAEAGAMRGRVMNAGTHSVRDLALAWSVLPVQARQHSSWAAGAAPGVPVDVVWRRGEETNPKAPESVSKYRSRAAEKNEMATKRRTKESDPLGFAELENLDRQHQAIYTALQDYLARRLDAYETRMAAQAAPQVRTSDAAMWQRVAAFAAVALIAVVTTLAVQRFWPKRQQSVAAATNGTVEQTDTTPDETTTTVAPRESIVTPFVTAARQSGKWADQFAAFSEQHPDALAKFVDTAANGQDTQADARRKLLDFSARLKGTRNALTAEDRKVLRPLLFEYIAKRDATEQSVDGKLNDVDTALLNRIKADWQLTTPVTDVSSWELQSELILRWLEANA